MIAVDQTTRKEVTLPEVEGKSPRGAKMDFEFLSHDRTLILKSKLAHERNNLASSHYWRRAQARATATLIELILQNR